MLLQLLFALHLWSFDKDIILEKQTEFNSSSHMTIYTSQEKKMLTTSRQNVLSFSAKNHVKYINDSFKTCKPKFWLQMW